MNDISRTDEGHDSGYVNKQVQQSSSDPDIFAIIFHVNLLDVFLVIGTIILLNIGSITAKTMLISIVDRVIR